MKLNKKGKAVVSACILTGMTTREISLIIMNPDCVNLPGIRYWRTQVNKYNKELNKSITSLLKERKSNERT